MVDNDGFRQRCRFCSGVLVVLPSDGSSADPEIEDSYATFLPLSTENEFISSSYQAVVFSRWRATQNDSPTGIV